MNLLPIIYTSLIVFTAFVVFVVTISYITYKIKEKNRVSYQTAPIDLTANYIDKRTNSNIIYPKNVYSEPNSNQKSETRANYYDKTIHADSYNENLYNTRVSRQTVVQMPRITKSYVQNNSYSPRYRTTNANSQNRFDILNKSKFQSNSTEPYESEVFNFLNYYADDEELNLDHSYLKVS